MIVISKCYCICVLNLKTFLHKNNLYRTELIRCLIKLPRVHPWEAPVKDKMVMSALPGGRLHMQEDISSGVGGAPPLRLL